jgi:transcriptional regulator GlxA family with amidase domain
MTQTVGIYIFDEVEVLDFAGPYEVFSAASRVHLRKQPHSRGLFDVITIADTMRTVRARGGLQVIPAHDFNDHPSVDVLVIPGGVVSAELERQEVIDWISKCAKAAAYIASVCTGAFLLGAAGLLDGVPVTTHWEDIDDLRAMFPGIEVRAKKIWVDAGKIVMSAGISAGIDMSLHLVERMEGKELAKLTARQMEYKWRSNK